MKLKKIKKEIDDAVRRGIKDRNRTIKFPRAEEALRMLSSRVYDAIQRDGYAVLMTLIPADLSNLTPYREHAHKCLSGDGKEFYRICKKLGLNPIIGIDRTAGTYKIIVSFRHYACS